MCNPWSKVTSWCSPWICRLDPGALVSVSIWVQNLRVHSEKRPNPTRTVPGHVGPRLAVPGAQHKALGKGLKCRFPGSALEWVPDGCWRACFLISSYRKNPEPHAQAGPAGAGNGQLSAQTGLSRQQAGAASGTPPEHGVRHTQLYPEPRTGWFPPHRLPEPGRTCPPTWTCSHFPVCRRIPWENVKALQQWESVSH